MVQKILQRSDIKPFKIKYYCEKRDPDFEAKMHEVLVVYQQIEMQFDEDGNLIKEDCHLTLFAPDREEKVSIIDGIYNSTDNEWNFTIPAEVTKELRGRYWYIISHAGKSLCFKEPIYFE